MKTIMIGVAVVFAATMFYGLGYTGVKNIKSGAKKGSIAAINGKEIDHKRFEQTLNRLFTQSKERVKPEQAMLYQTMALEQVIDFTLMLNEGKRHFGVSRVEMDQTMDQIMQMNKIPSMNALDAALKNVGQNLASFKSSLKEEIIVSKMVQRIKGEVKVTPEDLREVKSSHILIMPRGNDEKADFEARAKAEDILKKIKAGANFAQMARQYSDDKGSGEKGGELGYFTTGSMVPEFEKIAFSLKPGEMSDVIRTQYGYHIVKVEDTRLRKISQKGKDINEEVLADKQEKAYRNWLYGLRQKAKIEVNEPLIRAHSLLLTGKINDAIAAYNEASIENPTNPYVHLFLGDAYMQAGNTDLALAEYRKTAEISGADPGLLISLGDIYAGMKNRDLAIAQYERASLIAGDNKALHTELKTIFNKMGAYSDAEKESAELKRIEKKEKFESTIQQQLK